jgi:hypothetical protein
MAAKLVRPRWETPDPPGVVGTYGTRVIRWAKRELGVTLGPWQSYALRRALRFDRHGDLVHRIVLLSTARQNGKSVIVRTFYGWLLDEGRQLPAFAGWTTLLAAAHDAKQARIIYRGVYTDLDGVPRIKAATRLTQYFGIEAGGLMLDTVTSQPGSARGLSAGAIAWDEMLTQRDWTMWEALAPTQSAQRSPIMLLTSTAGHADSVVLRAFYDRLKRQASGDETPDPTFYGAWWESADPAAGLDWKAISQANPALKDGRLTRAAIQSEYQLLPTDSWQRERLNHFVDVVVPGAFAPGVWSAIRLPSPLAALAGPFALGVDVQPGWDRATVCVAGVREDGRVGVEVVRDLRAADGEPITASRIIAAVEGFPDLDQVQVIGYDQVSGGAAAFARAGIESGLPWKPLKPSEVVAASMDVTELIHSGRLAADDPLLDAQVGMVSRRAIGTEGAFRFSRAASGGAIDAFLAATFAAHLIAQGERKPVIY